MATTPLVLTVILLSALCASAQTPPLPVSKLPNAELVRRSAINSTLFPDFDHGRDLLEQVRTTKADVHRRLMEESAIRMICNDCPPANLSDLAILKDTTANADLVVVGRVIRGVAALTSKRSFIFTNYQVLVSDVWHKGKHTTVNQGDEITLADAGGFMNLLGHRVAASISTHNGAHDRPHLCVVPEVPSRIQQLHPDGAGQRLRSIHAGGSFLAARGSGLQLWGDTQADPP